MMNIDGSIIGVVEITNAPPDRVGPLSLIGFENGQIMVLSSQNASDDLSSTGRRLFEDAKEFGTISALATEKMASLDTSTVVRSHLSSGNAV